MPGLTQVSSKDKLEARYPGPKVMPGSWCQADLPQSAFEAEGFPQDRSLRPELSPGFRPFSLETMHVIRKGQMNCQEGHTSSAVGRFNYAKWQVASACPDHAVGHIRGGVGQPTCCARSTDHVGDARCGSFEGPAHHRRSAQLRCCDRHDGDFPTGQESGSSVGFAGRVRRLSSALQQ